MSLALLMFAGCNLEQKEITKDTDSKEAIVSVQIGRDIMIPSVMYIETNKNTSAWYMQQHPEVGQKP